jgi:hypothetical protein
MYPVSQCAYAQSISRLLHRPFCCQKKQVSGLGKFLGSEVSMVVAASSGWVFCVERRRVVYGLEDAVAVRKVVLVRVEEERGASGLR